MTLIKCRLLKDCTKRLPLRFSQIQGSRPKLGISSAASLAGCEVKHGPTDGVIQRSAATLFQEGTLYRVTVSF